MTPVITRFAPSPTGLKHPGNYRTAVFAYLVARHYSGSFILRIEDTDHARSKKEYETDIHEALAWLNLLPDQEFRQSEHAPRHRELLERLIAQDTAYISKETPREQGGREEVIRFRNSGGSVTFTDSIRGAITIDVSDLGDFVIARSLDEPLFHLAVVVDDADEGVTHVIRGEDHISNTPRQILIQRALGFNTPTYAHLPLLLSTDRSKLSTRHGAKPLTQYRDEGFLPEAMLNYLAFLGWNPGTDSEYLSREELISAFDLSRVQKGSAIFDETKLRSVNQHWMRELSDTDFVSHLSTRFDLEDSDLRSNLVLQAVPLLKERAQTFAEANSLLTSDLSCLFMAPTLDKAKLSAKEPLDRSGLTKTALETLLEAVKSLPEGVSAEVVKDTLMPLADAEEAVGKGDRGALLWPLRYALSGQERSPDPFTLISLLGVKEAVARIEKASAMLAK